MRHWFPTMLCVALALRSAAALSFDLPADFGNGSAGEAAIAVHQPATGFFVLRQSKRSHFEAPFMYLIAGSQRAVLIDTGATPDDGTTLPLRATVDRLLADWRGEHPDCTELLVVHTHAHGDHVANEEQFAQRANTVVVAATLRAMQASFGIEAWPQDEGEIELGDRRLSVLPLPGHEPNHVAYYDPASRSLLTGDTLYPGLLTIRDLPAYRASLARLAAFVQAHPVDQVLGAHIEMSRTPSVLYPLGSRQQANEHALALAPERVSELARMVEQAGDFRHDLVAADFIVRQVALVDDDRPAIHGMLLLARTSHTSPTADMCENCGPGDAHELFVSHLPMFHPAHDFQLIAAASFDPATRALQLADARAHPDAIYTIVPREHATLTALVKADTPIRVDLYRGHFERGGLAIARDLPLRLERVVHFRRFAADSSRGRAWIVFGRGPQRWLAHRIEAAPDFDQIVEISGGDGLTEGQQVDAATDGELSLGSTMAGATVARLIYLEYQDLERRADH